MEVSLCIVALLHFKYALSSHSEVEYAFSRTVSWQHGSVKCDAFFDVFSLFALPPLLALRKLDAISFTA